MPECLSEIRDKYGEYCRSRCPHTSLCTLIAMANMPAVDSKPTD